MSSAWIANSGRHEGTRPFSPRTYVVPDQARGRCRSRPLPDQAEVRNEEAAMTLLRPHVGEWTAEQTRALLAAARSAPTRSYEHPWLIELRRHSAFVYERLSMRRRDPAGRDRLLSCGAVVANLHTTIRALGWEPELITGPWREPDLIA